MPLKYKFLNGNVHLYLGILPVIVLYAYVIKLKNKIQVNTMIKYVAIGHKKEKKRRI